MDTGPLVVPRALSFEARREFIAATPAAMGSTEESVELDCSTVEVPGPIDDAVIGMLVTLARAARRRGSHVSLVRAPRPMRSQFEEEGVAWRFDWPEQSRKRLPAHGIIGTGHGLTG
jgi:ABC-type transporter Mla MlaB component